ncbi:MAG: hypothetical protein LBS92_04505 [Candidatus Methanoplasma sp.]|jgi:hypothetical protein|nr:hypothetical protein [Candidatus Methanoplasma sp.]
MAHVVAYDGRVHVADGLLVEVDGDYADVHDEVAGAAKDSCYRCWTRIFHEELINLVW